VDGSLTAEAALLAALFQGPSYGLDLFRRIGRLTGGRLRPTPGSGYPALSSLARRGLVRSWVVRRGRGRPRRYFELTRAGITAVLDQRRVIDGLVRPRPATPVTRRERTRMAVRIDECAELSELATSLREHTSGRTHP
jgi:DNA-binding PadR family transcriptional regulator